MSKGIPRQSRQVVDPLRTNVNLNTLQSLPKQASQLSVKNVQPQDVIEADILFEAMNLPMRKFERDAVGTESVVPDTEKVTTSALGVGDVQPARLEK